MIGRPIEAVDADACPTFLDKVETRGAEASTAARLNTLSAMIWFGLAIGSALIAVLIAVLI